jgi:hypothetical protein
MRNPVTSKSRHLPAETHARNGLETMEIALRYSVDRAIAIGAGNDAHQSVLYRESSVEHRPPLAQRSGPRK